MFLCSPRFELPMGTSEQPPLPQQIQNQGKVRKWIQDSVPASASSISGLQWDFFLQLSVHSLPQTAASSGRSSLSLIQLTNSSPGQRQQNNTNIISHQNNMNANRGPRPLDQVTCYKVSRLRLCSCSVIVLQ